MSGTRLGFLARDPHLADVIAIGLGPLQDRDVSHRSVGYAQGVEDIGEHQPIGIDLLLVDPAGDEISLLEQRRVHDVGDRSRSTHSGTNGVRVAKIDAQMRVPIPLRYVRSSA